MLRKLLKRLMYRRTRWAVVMRYDTRPSIERGWTGELAGRFLGKGRMA